MSVTDSGQGVSHLSRDMDRNTEDMDTEVKKIEDLSLNAWPSWQMQVYDGWILRYSSFYTHRTNCVEQIGEPHLPLSEKVPYCEAVYRRWKTPCVFKISPVGSPDLDAFLAARGYVEQHRTTVMTRCLDDTGSDPIEDSDVPLTIENNVSHAWMEGLSRSSTWMTSSTGVSFLPCTMQFPRTRSPFPCVWTVAWWQRG